jgi:hypothetical protein
MASNNYIYKMSNAGGMSTVTRYVDMLAGNTTWSPWEPAGAYDALATVTVPSGGAASVTFAGIPTEYKHLQVRYIARATSGGSANFTMTYNGDTASNYAWHALFGNGATASAAAGSPQPYVLAGEISSVANTFSTGVIDILDYANTNKFKTMRDLNGADYNGSGFAILYSGLWRSTAAINQVSFGSATFAQHSTFALYGVK